MGVFLLHIFPGHGESKRFRFVLIGGKKRHVTEKAPHERYRTAQAEISYPFWLIAVLVHATRMTKLIGSFGPVIPSKQVLSLLRCLF